MNHQMTLGKSGLRVPRMGIGAMVWGQPKGMAAGLQPNWLMVRHMARRKRRKH